MSAVTLSGIVVSMNTYNALGQRVEDVTQASTTEEAYGADGALLARYTGDSNSRSFVPFKGRLLAEYYCGGVIFDHPDEIGSATTATDCTGKNVQERLYHPFGEFWNGAGSLGMHQMFAQLPDYDPETDQYNTANRHYTPMGRWLGPDPAGLKAVRLDDPQTWNMYAYARNNPTTLTDPSGLTPPPPESSSSCVTDYGPGPCGQPPTQATQTGANTEAQEQPQASEKPQNQQNTPPPDSRTDIVLFPRELPIAPLKGTYGWFWEMDWEAGTCSAGACRKNQNLTITLQESTNGGPFKLTGDPGKGGEVQDQISPEPKTFNQRWFVSDPGGKPRQVQIVWGKSSQDTLLKTWELHVVIKNFGDRPVYSPVQ